jgi:hypothetical protein
MDFHSPDHDFGDILPCDQAGFVYSWPPPGVSSCLHDLAFNTGSTVVMRGILSYSGDFRVLAAKGWRLSPVCIIPDACDSNVNNS